MNDDIDSEEKQFLLWLPFDVRMASVFQSTSNSTVTVGPRHIPINARRLSNVVFTLAHRLQRWANIKTTFDDKRLVFGGMPPIDWQGAPSVRQT